MRTIGQHIGRPVIARDNDKRIAVLGIKHIVISHVSINLSRFHVDEFQLLWGHRRQDASALIKELRRLDLRIMDTHFAGCQIQSHEGASHQ